ncbi:MAG: hypothetical protein H7Z10_15270 [Gemmatimonadaceae bacterium]|nr:hypothetical protein [Acetobacteraceae bacterium]
MRTAACTALAIALVASSGAGASECECKHLPLLQIELRNALQLQAEFKEAQADLRQYTPDTSQAAYKQFTERKAGRKLENDGSKVRAFDYVPYGTLALHRIDTGTPEELCRLTDSAEAELKQIERTAECAGIARAIRTHEETHGNLCRAIGYRAHLSMHGSDSAAGEANAYGAQAAVIRAEIAKIVEGLKPRIEMSAAIRAQPPANAMVTALAADMSAELAMSPTQSNAAGQVRFDGAGRQTLRMTADGACRVTAGSPATVALQATMETDGLEARVSPRTTGALPGIGMRCQLPGAGAGQGMSMPAPPINATPDTAVLLLRDGAEKVVDIADTPGGRAAAQRGVRLTGQWTVRLRMACPVP